MDPFNGWSMRGAMLLRGVVPRGLTIQMGAAQNAGTYVVIRQSPALQAIQD